MSQDPLRSIRRRPARERGTFPDARYFDEWLAPGLETAEALLSDRSFDVYTAHALMLGEQRIVDPASVAQLLQHLLGSRADVSTQPHHMLSRIQSQATADGSDDVLMALAQEEVAVTAGRMALRERLLALADVVLDTREAMSELASGHLTTLVLATSNGQVVQPTSLGHYLAGHVGPLTRVQQRLQEAYTRLNRCPMGAMSGMSTAMPIRRGRVSDLLGFDGVIENTLDAIAGLDVLHEITTITAVAAVETGRLIADIAYWSRDDVGLLVPGDEFVHAGSAQPQRRDPLVLDHLRVAVASLSSTPVQMSSLLLGQQGLGGDATRQRAIAIVEEHLNLATRFYRLLGSVLRTSIVNRAMFANRTNRGFSTSSELADLLMVDFELPRTQAVELAERVVIEATEMGGDATSLTTELVDQIALRLAGREIGIEAEMLARCLSPKRFVERRTATGAPAPQSVGQALEDEEFAARRDRGWVRDRRDLLDSSRRGLIDRAHEVIASPDVLLKRPQPDE